MSSNPSPHQFLRFALFVLTVSAPVPPLSPSELANCISEKSARLGTDAPMSSLNLPGKSVATDRLHPAILEPISHHTVLAASARLDRQEIELKVLSTSDAVLSILVSGRPPTRSLPDAARHLPQGFPASDPIDGGAGIPRPIAKQVFPRLYAGAISAQSRAFRGLSRRNRHTNGLEAAPPSSSNAFVLIARSSEPLRFAGCRREGGERADNNQDGELARF